MILTVAYALWGVNEQEMGWEKELKKKGEDPEGLSPRTLAFSVCRRSKSNDYLLTTICWPTWMVLSAKLFQAFRSSTVTPYCLERR